MKPSKAIAQLIDICPITDEAAIFADIKVEGDRVILFTVSEATAWAHTITTEEVDPAMINVMVQVPALN